MHGEQEGPVFASFFFKVDTRRCQFYYHALVFCKDTSDGYGLNPCHRCNRLSHGHAMLLLSIENKHHNNNNNIVIIIIIMGT